MTTVVLVLARTVHIGSAMVLVALLYFVLIIVQPILSAAHDQLYSALHQNILKGLWWALILEAFSGVIWFWLVAAQMINQSPWAGIDLADLETVLWQTRFGELWLARATMGIALVVVLVFLSRSTVPAPSSSLLIWLFCALSAGLVITLAWAGHAAASIRYHGLHLVADVLHLLIGGIWPMGLIPLAGFLWHIKKDNQILPPDCEIKVLRRFSRISLLAVLILVVTGTVNGCLMVGSWEALSTTFYGRLLLGKVLVVAMMIGLGVVNRLYFLPRIKDEPVTVRPLFRTILIESFLAVVVLLIVGIMGMTPPPS